MPDGFPHPCNRCRKKLTFERFCDQCGLKHKQRMADIKKDDPNRDLYSSRRWRKFRLSYLIANPFCIWPMEDGRKCGAQSTTPDHKKPISEGGEIWDEKNLQPLCHSHHSAKTMRESRERWKTTK